VPRPASYAADFARAYRRLYGSYGRTLGARIAELPGLVAGGRVLDLGCGSGELAGFLAERGFAVTGLDREPDMLALARATAPQAHFVQGEMTDLRMPGPFDLVTAISHSLNHLPGLDELRRCLGEAARVAAPGALLLVDLVTRRGMERWNAVTVDEEPDYLLIRRGFYDDPSRSGCTRMSGFLLEKGAWLRFAAVLCYRAFTMAEVLEVLSGTGWADPVLTSRTDLATPLDDPEARRDVVLRARRVGGPTTDGSGAIQEAGR